MASTPDDIQRAHDALLHDKSYQFTLSTFKPPKDPDWLVAFFKWLEHAWPFIKWTLLGVAALIVVAIAVQLVRTYLPRWRARNARAPQGPGLPAWQPTAAQARQLLDESDAYAARGLYGEAVHLILLRSIEDIRAQRPRLVRPTLTSREIARLDALPERGRSVFSGIAQVVERALFAGRDIGKEEFESCRAAYSSYAFANALGDGR